MPCRAPEHDRRATAPVAATTTTTVGTDERKAEGSRSCREIRGLLRRLADKGVTILLSSHLLAEVELSCSHVVVMDRGRLVAAESVPELVGAGARTVYVEVDDPTLARTVLATLPTVKVVTTDAEGFALELDGVDRTEVVSTLVHGGVGVRTITARWQLEDAFLGLVGSERAH